jgi:hypothetical protein
VSAISPWFQFGELNMSKHRKIDLENLPAVLERAAALMDKEIITMSAKESLTPEDARNLISYTSTLRELYRDYRAEVKAIREELKGRTKEDLLALVKSEGR